MCKRTAFYVCMFVQVMLVMACTRSGGPETPQVDCNISNSPCVRQADGLTVTFEIYPRPVRAMREVSFGVLLEQNGAPVDNAEVSADFTMPGMFMGKNFYTLPYIGESIYRTEGVLPRCPSGGKLWRCEVTIQRPGEGPVSVVYLFEVD